MQRFSKRTQWDVAETPYATAVAKARAAGGAIYDLTASNPTTCGFDFDAAGLLEPLANPAALVYDPDPRGMRSAREAVAGYYADHGIAVDADALVLTTSTSEAYSFLFRLLCDPGDELLVAQPSYPLFDFLADLDDVVLKPYPLFYDHGWSMDIAALEAAITPKTRAVLLVHPNNPTGHYTSAAERQELEAICVRHGLALIVDEVFLDYTLGAAEGESFAAGEHPVLTFVLSGMSKIAALPQMKVSWIACFGPETLRAGALERLEVIADTFLSMNAPAQLALPAWLAGRHGIQQQILERVRQNLAMAEEILAGQQLAGKLDMAAGWNLILTVPATADDQILAARLAIEAGVIVHPGSFYGMQPSGRLVLSLLPQAESFRAGMRGLTLLLSTP